MEKLTDSEIIESWKVNAKSWINAISNEEIESRKLITNQVIISKILNPKPRNVLDIGCGEGWLARKIASENVKVLGIDIVPDFIDYANQKGNAEFDVCSYENLATYHFKEKFECIVCNFSLIGKEATETVIRTSKELLSAKGRLIIQTLHPIMTCGDLPYRDSWRSGSWSGFNNEFVRPAPWYFRTIESWFTLLSNSGFNQNNVSEPIHPKTQKPASIIFESYTS